MTQVSKYPLDKTIEKEIFQKFQQSISVLRDANSVAAFFSDFFTDTERIMFAKRLTVAVLLMRGKKAKEIKSVLNVSNSTTGTVTAWLKNANPKTRAILEHVIKKSDWESLIDTFEGFLDSLPPRYGTNWSRVGRERRERRMERLSRQSVR
jgi:uncharacterized protein YerC